MDWETARGGIVGVLGANGERGGGSKHVEAHSGEEKGGEELHD